MAIVRERRLLVTVVTPKTDFYTLICDTIDFITSRSDADPLDYRDLVQRLNKGLDELEGEAEGHEQHLGAEVV